MRTKSTASIRALRPTAHGNSLARPLSAALAAVMVLEAAAPAFAQAVVPSGGRVVSGSATITAPNASNVTINQSSQRAVIDWNAFSVGQSNSVTFNQSGRGAAVLNRVTGDTTSEIAGRVTGNGQVFLVNPNGIAITSSGTVRADGGFAASTLDITTGDFMSGRLNFRGKGSSAGVVNQGSVSSGPGGYAALIGGTVANDGTVTVPVGRVGMGSGEQATLDINGNSFLQVAVPTATANAAGRARVDMRGRIDAAGGTVELKAATVRQAVRDVVNVPGTINAQSVGRRNGTIVLDGGAGGSVSVSGQLNAAGRKAEQLASSKSKIVRAGNGGRIAVRGGDVAVSGQLDASGSKGGRIDISGTSVQLSGATVSARGVTSGGLVRIGGAFQGGKTGAPAIDQWLYAGRFGDQLEIQAADKTSIDAVSKIDVSATSAKGTAGTVVVWSNVATDMRGSVIAQGEKAAVEISSASALLSVDLAAMKLGNGGKLLLDPKDIVVWTAAGSDPAGSYSYDGGATTTYLNNQAISDLLVGQGLDVRLQASNSISWSGSLGFSSTGTFAQRFGTLTLQAGNSVTVSSNFFSLNHGGSGQDGNLVIIANDPTAVGPRNPGTATINLVSTPFDMGGTGNVSITMSAGAVDLGGKISLARIDAGSVDVRNLQGDWVQIGKDITTTGAQTYAGGLRINPLTGSTVTLTSNTSTVTWLDESTKTIVSGAGDFVAKISIVESGKQTRYGLFQMGAPTDATRLALGPDVAASFTRVYGDDNTTLTPALTPQLRLVSGTLAGADTLSSILTPGTLVVTGPAATAPAGTAYATTSTTAPTGFAFAGGLAGSYLVDLRDAQTAVTIKQRVLTATVTSGIYVYGSPQSIVMLGNVFNGDDVTPTVQLAGNGGLTALTANGGTGFALPASTSVGNQSYALAGLAGLASGNYTLAPIAIGQGSTVAISPKVLTYAGNNASSTYGSAPPALSVTLDGVLAGDQVTPTGVQTSLAGTVVTLGARTPASTYQISATGLSGAAAGNYVLATDGATNPSLTIAPKTIGYTLSGFDPTYGAVPPTAALQGILAGDAVVGQVYATPYANGIAVGPAAPYTQYTRVGGYKVGVGALIGADAGNYVVDPALGQGIASVAIQPRVISASITDASVVYGTGATLSASLSGVLPNDVVLSSVDVSKGLVSYGASLPATAWAGAYTARATGISGADAGNYVFSVNASTPGTITVTPKPVTYSIANVVATYGDNITTPTPALTGLLPADQAQIAAATGVTNAANQPVTPGPTLGAGSYTSRVTGLSSNGNPGLSDNYVIDHASSTAGRIDIGKRTLTYTLNDVTGVYGSAITLTDTANAPNGRLSGLVNGERAEPVASVLTTVPGVITSQLGTGLNFVNAGAPAGAYRYGITGVAGISGTGFDPANYTLQTPSPANLTIAPKVLTYVGDSVTSTYGTLAAPTAVLSGIYGNDDVAATMRISLGNVVYPLTSRLGANTYTTTASGLTGAASANYTLSLTGNADGMLTVQPKALAWSVANASSTYGTQATPGAVTLTGVLPGDDVQGAVTVRSGSTPVALAPDTPAGTYRQYVTGLSGSEAANYVPQPFGPPSNLTVDRMPVTVQIASATRQFGQTNPVIGYAITQGQLLSVDNIALNTFTSTYEGSNVGTYPTLGAATGVTGNYNFTFIPGTLLVTPQQVRYTVNAPGDWVYGTRGTTPTATFQPISGFVSPFQPAYSLTTTDAASQVVTLQDRSNAGIYKIKPVVTDPNYQVVGGQDGSLTIGQRALTLNGLAGDSAVYGSAPTAQWKAGVLPGDTVAAKVDSFAQGSQTFTTADYWLDSGAYSPGRLPPNVGQYRMTGLSLYGASASNYTFDNALLNQGVSRTFDITPKPITVIGLNPVNAVYGTLPGIVVGLGGDRFYDNATGFRVNYSGLLNPNNDTYLMTPQMGAISTLPNAGSYNWRVQAGGSLAAVNPNTGVTSACAIGMMCANYVLADSGHAQAVLNITPKPITATVVSSADKITYGIAVTQTVTLDGVLDKDLSSLAPVVGFKNESGGLVLRGSTVQTDANGGSGTVYAGTYDRVPAYYRTATQVATGARIVLPYDYTVGVAELAGPAAANYTVQSVVTTKLQVMPRELTYETYGPVTSYYALGALGNSMYNFGRYGLTGVLPGDQVGISEIEARRIQPWGTDKTGISLATMTKFNPGVGEYEMVATKLGGAAGNNYLLATSGNTNGRLYVISLDGIAGNLDLLGTNTSAAIAAGIAAANAPKPATNPDPNAALPQPTPAPAPTPAPSAPPSTPARSTLDTTLPGTSTGTGQGTSTSGSALDGTLRGNASAGQQANAQAGVSGTPASAGAGQNAQATGCIGSVCETVGAETDINAKISLTPISVKASVHAGADVSETTTVQFMCGSSPCSISNTLTAGVDLDASFQASLKSGFKAEATVDVSVSDDTKWKGSCGAADCSASIGVTAGVLAGISNKQEFRNGLTATEKLEAGAHIGVDGSYDFSIGGVSGGVSAGLSTGTFNIGSNFSATFESGELKIDIGAQIGVGIFGVSLDLKLGIDMSGVIDWVAGTDTTVRVYVDPAAAQARLEEQKQILDDIQALQSRERTFMQVLMTGQMQGPQVYDMLTRLKDAEFKLDQQAYHNNFSYSIEPDGHVKLVDKKPPAMTDMVIHHEGGFEHFVHDVSDAFSGL